MISFIIILLAFYKSLLEEKANVYFTKDITPSNMVKIFKKLNITLKGKVGLKVHSGETGGKYFLSPDFLQEIYEYVNGTFIECNAAYDGGRNTTERHKELLKDHGWLDKNRRTVIMDEDCSNDFNLTIENPEIIEENIVGGHLSDFDSCIVLAHFKGHPMGGFGGALKQLSIGFASQAGKTWIHTGGNITRWQDMDYFLANEQNFTAAMGDAASSIVNYFRKRGGIAFINVMSNISLWCDCAGADAPEPKIHDMGILASTDPVAIDRACLDMIRNHTDVGTDELLEQIKNLTGENIITVAEKHGIGSQEFNFIDIDENTPFQGSATGLIIFICIIVGAVSIAVLLAFWLNKKDKFRKKEKEVSLVETKED